MLWLHLGRMQGFQQRGEAAARRSALRRNLGAAAGVELGEGWDKCMSVVGGWILTGGMIVWICAVLWAAGVPKGLRPWLKQPKNASRALRWLTWVLAGAFAGIAWVAWASDPTSELGGFRTEATGIALAVIVIEEISRARAYLDYKQSIIQQMASRSNDFALDAARIAKDEGWLQNRSFQGADLAYADLQGADLSYAKLQDADLERAKLQGAELRRTDLQDAKLSRANLQDTVMVGVHLQGADLSYAKLQGAELIGAKFQGARYDDNTIWPDGFRPPADAINVDEQEK